MKTIEKDGYKIRKSDKLEYFKVSPGVWGMKIVFVNIYIVATGDDEGKDWVLIDAGLKGSGAKIRRLAEHLFGAGTTPSAILLTHGHFDHVGALEEILDFWDVPVYAHYLELPYLKGLSSYPPPDPMVGGGLMSLMSWIYPRSPKDLGNRIKKLNMGAELEELPGWKFIHTPGHSPGQVSIFRESDKTLIAGDAFVTTKQESAFSVMIQRKVLSGPPKYFTIDWSAARESVKALRLLEPEVAATGHGYPMYGEELQASLADLADHFDEKAVPHYGRYVKEPARANKNGVQYIPRKVNNPVILTSVFILAGLTTAGLLWGIRRR